MKTHEAIIEILKREGKVEPERAGRILDVLRQLLDDGRVLHGIDRILEVLLRVQQLLLALLLERDGVVEVLLGHFKGLLGQEQRLLGQYESGLLLHGEGFGECLPIQELVIVFGNRMGDGRR